MSLFDLIEQHHRVRLAPNRLAQLATFLVADITRRSTDQPADGVLLLVFRHVQPDHVLIGVEQGGGQGPGQLVLPTPVGPRKMNDPTGRDGSAIPALDRMMASVTAWTASS